LELFESEIDLVLESPTQVGANFNNVWEAFNAGFTFELQD
jgi:hypothetical protein